MKHRPLGKTGITVSEIGLGAWQLANPQWGASDESDALRIVHAALDAGCNFFDTAPGYSNGTSERLLGQALAGKRDHAVLCTKFGHDAAGKTDWSAAALAPSVEASLQRLQTDHLDVLLLHNPRPDTLSGEPGAALRNAVEKLHHQGKIRAYGASIDTARHLAAVTAWPNANAAEILFNAFHQEPAPAFPAAHARGVGLIVKVPLDSGWLSGKYHARTTFTDVRSRWPAEIIARRAAMLDQLRQLLPPDITLPQLALQFILAHPEISTIIPGAKSIDQVQANITAANTPLSPSTLAQIRHLYQTHLAPNPLPW